MKKIIETFWLGLIITIPPKTKIIVWTMRENVLKVSTFGKNYETNKFSAYTADYERCSEDFSSSRRNKFTKSCLKNNVSVKRAVCDRF